MTHNWGTVGWQILLECNLPECTQIQTLDSFGTSDSSAAFLFCRKVRLCTKMPRVGTSSPMLPGSLVHSSSHPKSLRLEEVSPGGQVTGETGKVGRPGWPRGRVWILLLSMMGIQKVLSKGEPQYFSHFEEVVLATMWEEAVARQGGSGKSGGSCGGTLGKTTVP